MATARGTAPTFLLFTALASLPIGSAPFAYTSSVGLRNDQRRKSIPMLLVSDYSKWDNLVDEDEDEDEDDSNKPRIPSDMKYVLPNIKRQSDNFEAIRNMGGLELTSDVWMRAPADDCAWFVGRIARVSDVSPERAIDRQFPLIERHAWALRPTDLHPSRGPFVVYYALGETEEFVSVRDPSIPLTRVEEDAVRGAFEMVKSVEVGFRGASYGEGTNEVIYKVDLGNEDESDILKSASRSAYGDEDMEEVVEKLRTKPVEQFFNDDDWKEFVDKV